MPRITVNLDDAAYQWVQEEADVRDTSMSAVVAGVVEDARGGESDRPALERIAAVESRLDDVEADIRAMQGDADERITEHQGDAKNRIGPMQADDTAAHQSDTAERSNAHQGDAGLAEGLDIPGRGYDETEARREVASQLLAWVREQGSVKKGDVLTRFLTPEIQAHASYDTEDGFWESFARGVLLESEQVEEDGRSYVWDAE